MTGYEDSGVKSMNFRISTPNHKWGARQCVDARVAGFEPYMMASAVMAATAATAAPSYGTAMIPITWTSNTILMIEVGVVGVVGVGVVGVVGVVVVGVVVG